MMQWVRRFMNRRFDNVVAPWLGISWNQLLDAVSRGGSVRPALLLTTRGAKSGEPRECVLPFFREGSDIVIIASNAGGTKDPAWVSNLRKYPRVKVKVRGRQREAIARIAEADERDRLYARACLIDPIYTAYQGRTDRRIPAIVLQML